MQHPVFRAAALSRLPLLLAAFMIVIAPGLNAQQVPVEYMSRLESQIGAGNHTVAGAAAGFVVGAGATYLLLNSGGSTSLCNRDRNQDAIGRTECLGLTAAGGVVGAGIGALIGSRIRRGNAVQRYQGGTWGMGRSPLQVREIPGSAPVAGYPVSSYPPRIVAGGTEASM